MSFTGTTLTFCEWMRIKRQRKEVSQKDLARALQLSNKTISAWETGESVPKLTPTQMLILCEKLDCSLQELAEAQGTIAKRAS